MKTPPPGRRALVTGSFQGIGLAIAEALAAEGCHLVLHGLATPEQQASAHRSVLAAGAASVTGHAHDLTDAAQAAALMDEVLAAGALDILVNNAGIQHTAPLADMPAEVWDRILAINLSAAFHTMKAAKFGLIGLSRVAALEYASAGTREQGGVTVNCICPGWTETAIIEPQIVARAAEFGGDRTAGVRDLLREKQPSQRTSVPAEIGQLTAWLCHPVAHNITGAAIPIEGGWTSQ